MDNQANTLAAVPVGTSNRQWPVDVPPCYGGFLVKSQMRLPVSLFFFVFFFCIALHVAQPGLGQIPSTHYLLVEFRGTRYRVLSTRQHQNNTVSTLMLNKVPGLTGDFSAIMVHHLSTESPS